jgi:hypothetical protein
LTASEKQIRTLAGIMKRILFFCLAFACFSFHPFYLSVTDLNYNAPEKALQGTVKIFVNDFEGALKKFSGKPVDLIHPKDSMQTRKLIGTYLSKKLSVTVNGTPKTVEVIGFEHESENIWVYIEVPGCGNPRTIGVENTLLFEYLKEQINIVQLEINGHRKSSRLVNPQSHADFTF